MPLISEQILGYARIIYSIASKRAPEEFNATGGGKKIRKKPWKVSWMLCFAVHIMQILNLR